MKHFYYKYLCGDPLKVLRYHYEMLCEKEIKLLQSYLILEANVLAGNDRYAVVSLSPLRHIIEGVQISKSNYELMLEHAEKSKLEGE